jgi:hypothetical protein
MEDAHGRLRRAFDEDLGNLCCIQESIEADPSLSIPLSTHEILIHQLHAELDSHIPEGVIDAALRIEPVSLPRHVVYRDVA